MVVDAYRVKVIYLAHVTYEPREPWIRFSERLTELNIKKALPGVMAELNKQLFRGMGEGSPGDLYDEDVDLGEWVVLDGKLTPADSQTVKGKGLPILSPGDLLRFVMGQQKGQVVVIR